MIWDNDKALKILEDEVKLVQCPVGESDYTKEILKQLKEKEAIVNISSDEDEDVDHDNGENAWGWQKKWLTSCIYYRER